MGADGEAEAQLDRAFMALADPVRRAMVARLSRGPATVNELAVPFAITKQAVSKHIQVLEQAGLVTRTRDAQRRPVHLDGGRPGAADVVDRPLPLGRRTQLPPPGRAAGGDDTDTERKETHNDQRTRPGGAGGHPGHGVHPRVRRTRGSAVPRACRTRTGQAVARAARPARWRSASGSSRTTAAIATPTRTTHGTFGFNGTFHTVRENEFILQTFEFEGAPDMVNIEFMWFEDLGGGPLPTAGPVDLPQHRGAGRTAVVRNGGRHDRGLREARRAARDRCRTPEGSDPGWSGLQPGSHVRVTLRTTAEVRSDDGCRARRCGDDP